MGRGGDDVQASRERLRGLLGRYTGTGGDYVHVPGHDGSRQVDIKDHAGEMFAPYHGVDIVYAVRGVEGSVGLPVDEGGLQPLYLYDQALSLHALGRVRRIDHRIAHLEGPLQGMRIRNGGVGHVHLSVRRRRPRGDGDVGRGVGGAGHADRVDGDAAGGFEHNCGLGIVDELRLVAGDVHVHAMSAGEGGGVHAVYLRVADGESAVERQGLELLPRGLHVYVVQPLAGPRGDVDIGDDLRRAHVCGAVHGDVVEKPGLRLELRVRGLVEGGAVALNVHV